MLLRALILFSDSLAHGVPSISSNLRASRLKKTFITDRCLRDSDCVSGCCGFNSGLCAGPVVAIERDGACGFGNSISNCNAAKLLGFKNVTGCRNLRV